MHADVFVTLRVRRAALMDFMLILVTAFEKDKLGLISPVYSAFLQSELDQQRVTQEMAEEEGEEEGEEG